MTVGARKELQNIASLGVNQREFCCRRVALKLTCGDAITLARFHAPAHY